MRWFVGDLHFGHEKVSRIRGFKTVLEHDAALYRAWYRQVGDDDEVWVLGDISSGRPYDEDTALRIIRTLPGTKHLIAGNHDSVSSIHRNGHKKQREWFDAFDSVQQFARMRMEGHQILLSHYPYVSQGDGPGRGEARYTQYRLRDEGLHLIHAHTHHDHPTSGGNGRELCVSWDAWGRLASESDVSKWLRTG